MLCLRPLLQDNTKSIVLIIFLQFFMCIIFKQIIFHL